MDITKFETEKYVSQKKGFNKLPYGYIDKQICGCGATTIAIENNADTIILMPSQNLVKNKVAQYPNERCDKEIFGVYCGIKENDVREYVAKMKMAHKPYKLLVCYDSISKVEYLFENCNSIIIDESQKLLQNCSMKADKRKKIEMIDAYTMMLNTLEKYKQKLSFLSATPIPLEYMPSFMQDLPYIKFEFKNVTKSTPFLVQVAHPNKYLEDYIIRPLNQDGYFTIKDEDGKEHTFKKVIVFMNTVQGICNVAENCNLKKEDVGIICGDSIRNDAKIYNYNRVENPRALTRFTFITSSGFDGIDLYDKEAISIVVSNTKADNEMLNLATDLKQCVSRNRDYNEHFIFIFNQNLFEKSKEELLEIIYKTRKRIEDNCSTINEQIEKGDTRHESNLVTFSKDRLFKKYVFYYKGKWLINENVFNADKYFIEVTHEQYRKGFDVVGEIESDNVPIKIVVDKEKSPYSYESLIEKYEKINNGEDITFSEDEKATDNYKLIDAYYKKFKKLQKRKDRAKELLDVYGKTYNKVRYYIKEVFKIGGRMTIKEYKEKMASIYKGCGITRKPKKEDLYECSIGFKEERTKSTRYIVIQPMR